MLETDTAKMLKEADKEIKCITYQLQTVISDGNYHNVLHPNIMTDIEVIEN